MSVVGGDGAGEPGADGFELGIVVNRRPVDTENQPYPIKLESLRQLVG